MNWVINTLAEITAKGGCFALNVGPSAKALKKKACKTEKVGEWLKRLNHIYATRITPNYNYGNVWFTANKDGQTFICHLYSARGEKLPEYIGMGRQ